MTTAPAISTWAIDPVHSVPEFSVKHMVISTVKGRFTKVEGAIMLDEANPANSSVKATIDVTTIDTGEAQRDTHLRSADFFDVEKFPTIAFTSSKVERKSDDEYKVTGDLTIRDVTRPVVLDVEYEGQIKDAYGKQRAAFTATTQIDRKDFGLNWNMALEAGGFIVSNNVKVTLHIAAVRND
jgi:polyisoprenoid-binding protein YceI